jgi:hypothetical protein
MAPVPPSVEIPDLAFSSLELDSRSSKPFDLSQYLKSLSLKQREALTNGPETTHFFTKRSEDGTPILSPSDTFGLLTARDRLPSSTASSNPAAGSIDPNNINMKGVQAAFALIGAAFVVGAIWFFFWAKNGGFQWRKGDWEEYKSTVLRRKGPNGTTLSNATKSTKLGGGSVVGQGYSDDGSSVSGTVPFSDMSSEAPIMKEKSKKDKIKKDNGKDAKIRQVNEEKWEGGHDNDVRAYRHERVAKVGGLNRDSDAQFFGTDYSATDRSDIGNQRHSHHSSRQASPDKRQSRRDFSFGLDTGFTAAPAPSPRPPRYHSPTKPAHTNRQSVPGSFNEPMEFSDVQSQNTRSYHHPIPGLGPKAKPQGGFRRDRRDSLDD